MNIDAVVIFMEIYSMRFKSLVCTLLLVLEVFTVKATTYYISSSTGMDTNTEIQAQNLATPWKSIGKLNAFFANLNPGDSVLFKKGDVFNGSIIVSNSGIPFLPIILSAYGSGPDPVINGLITLSSWTEIKEGVYAATCRSCPPDVNQLVIDGIQQPIGRFPNTGYLSYEAHRENESISDNDLSVLPNWAGAEVVIRKNRWIIDKSPILSHSGKTIHYRSGTKDFPTSNFGYFIQKDPKTLDQIGEWYFDPVGKIIQVFFGDDNPELYDVEISVLNNLLNVTEQHHIVIENLNFKGGNGNTLKIVNSKEITVKNCRVEYSGGDAVSVIWSPYFTLENSHISNSLDNSLTLDQGCASAIIRNNIIKNTGLISGMGKSGSGTYQAIMSFGENTIIEGNVIDRVGYNGIYFGGNSTVVKNNFINNFCLVKDDGGGIYVGDWFRSSGKKIIGNIILNGKGEGDGTDRPFFNYAQGIYIDEPSGGVEILDNTVAYCGDAGLFVHNAHNLVIKNNTFYDNGTQLNISQDNVSPTHLIREVELNNNIFFSRDVFQSTISLSSTGNDINSFGNFNNNFFMRPLDDNLSIITSYVDSGKKFWKVYNLEDWQSESNKDLQSSKSPIIIPYYSVNDVLGSNKIPNGKFISDAWNSFAWSEDENAEAHWDDTDKIDGGSLIVSYTKPSITTTTVNVGITDIGALDSTKNYLLKFKTLGSQKRVDLGVFLQQTSKPFRQLTPVRYFTLTDSPAGHEVLFSHPTEASNSNLIFQLSGMDGPIWFDDIELHEADIDVKNPDDHIRFEYNPTDSIKTVNLDKPYLDVKNNRYNSFVTLGPFSSKILMTMEDYQVQNSQTITFPPISDKTLDEGEFTLVAEASSGLPVSFRILSGQATIQEATLTLKGPGTVAVEAFQEGGEGYGEAPSVIQTFAVKNKNSNCPINRFVYRINSGGPATSFGDQVWQADQYYSGGRAFSSKVAIDNTAIDEIYQSERNGDFFYDLPLPEVGLYTVNFYFSEIHWNRSSAREFRVQIENETPSDIIDIYKDFGGSNNAYIYTRENIKISDGVLNIRFISQKDRAKVSGITVIKEVHTQQEEIYRINTGHIPAIAIEEVVEASYYDRGSSYSISEKEIQNTRELVLGEDRMLKIYPNPAKDEIILDFFASYPGRWEFRIISFNGSPIYLGEINLKVGNHTLTFDISSRGLSAGPYLMNALSETGKTLYKSLIVH